MIAVEFILRNQIMIGMLGALFLFVSLRQRRKLFWLLMPCSAAAALAFSALVPIPMPFNFLAYFAAIALVVALCFKGGWKQVLFSTTCAYCVQHMTSKIVYLLLMFWAQFQYGYVTCNIELLSLALLLLANALVCIPIYCIWTRRVIRSGALKFDNFKTIIYTAVFILCAVFLCFFAECALDAGSPFFAAGYICLNALCALFAWMVLMMNFTNSRGEFLTEEKRTLEQLLKKDKQQYETARQNMERINIHYHDIKKRRVLAMDPEEARRLDEELKKIQRLYYTGNEVVDITLTEKAALCAEEGIQFICSVDGSRLNMIKPYQIYSLLGNAVDNAVESLRAVDDADKKVIRLDIFGRGNMSVIRVENYLASEPKKVDGMPVTTKPDKENHGFGLKSIKSIAEEYGGMIRIGTEDHQFTLVVAIPNGPQKK